MKNCLPALRIFIIQLGLILTASTLNAQTRTATVSGNWDNIATWGGASFPVAGNDVIINPGVTVTVNIASAACNSISFTAGAIGAGITISGTNALAVSGAVVMNGTTAITGTQTTLITVGTGSFSCGTIAINPIAANLGTTTRRTQVSASGGTITVNGSITCSGNVSGAGTSGINITGAGTLNVYGDFYTSPNLGYFGAGTGTVNYSGTAQTVLAAVYRILTISGSGTKTLSATGSFTTLNLTAGTLAAGTNLSPNAGGTPTITRNGGDITGTVQTNNDYDVTFTGASKTTGNELSGTGLRHVIVNLTAGETLTLDQDRTPDGNLSVTAGTLDLSTFTANRTTAGGTLTVSNGATLKIGGTNTFPTNYSTNTIGNTGATVEYSGANQNVAAMAGAEVYTNLTLSGSGVKTFVAETINGTLSMQGTATAAGASPTYGAAAILEYAGSTTQTSSNVEFPAAGGPRTLKINNATGVTLHAARTLLTSLNLTNGVLFTTTGSALNLADNATAINGSDNSFVDGPLSKTGNDAFTFPVGKSGAGLRTIGISAPASTTSVFTAEFVRSNPQALSSAPGSGLVAVSACEYWTLANTGTAGSVRVILSWATGSNCGGSYYIGNTNTIRVARLSAGTWNDEGRFSITGDVTAGTITSNNVVNSFGTAFTIGTSATDNALPVMFNDVKAFEKNRGIQIEWSNLTERDLINYIVERSVNGVNFSSLSQQSPRSNNNDKESYSAFDAAPFPGANYYRIKVLEISGKVIYSKVMRVDFGASAQGFTLYPNPVKGNLISVSVNNRQGHYTIKVINTSGQEIYSQRIIHQGGSLTQTVELPASAKPGVYSMVVSGDGYRQAKMFIVQ